MPRHSERRRARREELKLRRAPRIRKTVVSAVASLTATGVLETWMPCWVQAGMSSWS